MRVNLALQGGGAHGAYTWGVLDRLLEEDIEIAGISATSAGAMNAAALKAGWVANGNAGARDWLDRFWHQMTGLDAALTEPVANFLRQITPEPEVVTTLLSVNPFLRAAEQMSRAWSPYQLNPLGYHPLRDLVRDMFDYDAVCADTEQQLFINATNVRTGKIKVFRGREITPDAILASACLPNLFHAIEIIDPKTGVTDPYWDGGYMGNPALFPLFYHTNCEDVVIVHINPLERPGTPKTADEIANRLNEITFNSSLLRELRSVEFVSRLLDSGAIRPGTMKDVRIHSIKDEDTMRRLGTSTKTVAIPGLLEELKARGRASAEAFLAGDAHNIGNTPSVDLRAMFE